MSWSTFETDVEQMKERESVYFSATEETDEQIVALYKVTAKDMLARALYDAIPNADLDTLCVDHADDLKRALAFLQLHLLFMDNHNGAGSVNEMKAVHYLSQFRFEAGRFTQYRSGALQQTGVQPLWR